MTNRTFAKIIFFFCALLAFGNLFGQQEEPVGYQRLFFSNFRDIISTSSTPTGEGGYYLVSIFNEPNVGQPDSIGILVTKHDLKGDVVFATDHIIEEANFSLANKTIECERVGGDTLVVVAIDETTNLAEDNKFIMKLDGDGRLLWSSVISDIETDPNDTGYTSYARVVSGLRNEFSYFGAHDNDSIIGVHMERFDLENNSILSRTFYGATVDTIASTNIDLALRDVIMQRDSSMVMTMTTPGNNSRAAMMRLDSLGNPIQGQIYQIADSIKFDIEFTAVTETPDRGFAVVGNCLHNSLSEGIVVKLDSLMSLQWAKRIRLDAGARNQAQDVVVSETGDIVVAGRFLTMDFTSGNYAIFLDLLGELSRDPIRYQSENSLTAELTSGYSSNVNISNVRNDTTMIMSTTGASRPPSGLAPLLIKLGQDGAARCNDLLMVNSLDDLVFEMDTMAIQQNLLAQVDTLEVRTRPANLDVPVVNLGQESFCPREDTIHTFVATSEGAKSYMWSTGDTTETLDVDLSTLEAGEMMEFAVTVTICDRICYTLCDTGAVEKMQFPVASIEIDSTDFCQFNTFNLIASGSNETDGGVIWSNMEIADTITVPAVAGTEYSVTVTDDCDDDAVETITLPDLTPPSEVDFVLNNDALCSDRMLFLTASWPGNQFAQQAGLTYAWSTGEDTPQITIDEAGSYTVTITDGCIQQHQAIGTFDIADQLIIPPPNITINRSDLQRFGNGVCGIRLTTVAEIDPNAADIPGIDLVVTGDVNPTLDVTAVSPDPQVFTATATQCGEDFPASISISSADLDAPDPTLEEIMIGGLTNDCDIILSVNGNAPIGPGEFVWSNNVLGNQSTVSEPGTYMVTLTDACGQEVVASRTLTLEDFIPDLSEVKITFDKDTTNCVYILTATNVPPGSDVLWNTGEMTTTIMVTPETLLNPPTYSVTVNACSGSVEETEDIVAFEFANIFFPVRQVDERNASFGPELLCIEQFTGSYLLEIYNRWGKRVFESDNPQERWRGTLNNQGQFLEEDVYLYQCMYEGELVANGTITLARNRR